MCFPRWILRISCFTLTLPPALTKLIVKPQEDLCNLWAKISYAHPGSGLLCMTHKVQEDEVRSLDLYDEGMAFNALFPQRCSVFEDTIIWPCWCWRFLSILQLNAFLKVTSFMQKRNFCRNQVFTDFLKVSKLTDWLQHSQEQNPVYSLWFCLPDHPSS